MAIAATAFVATPSSYAQETSIATVVKIAGIQWFNRMEEGVKNTLQIQAQMPFKWVLRKQTHNNKLH